MRVLLAGGGTGGHLVPGLALAEALRQRDPSGEILFLGTDDGLERDLVPAHGFRLARISVGRGSPLSWRRPANLARFVRALGESDGWLRVFRPHAVVSLGGYATAPPGLMAAWRSVPLVLLEQNVIPGRVTRLLSRWASAIHLQFDEARKYLPRAREETLYATGSPLAPQAENLSLDPPCRGDALLIMGGSQGARRLNELAVAAARSIRAHTESRIIHVAGADNESAVRGAYAAAGIDAEVMGFCRDMPALYERSRLVLCRAGATSLAELAAAGLPALLVPLPSARDDHQRANASAVAAAGAALVLEQEETPPEILAETVASLWNDEPRRAAMADAMRALARPDAAERIAENLLVLTKRPA